MKNELVHTIKGDVYTSSVTVAEMLSDRKDRHRNIMLTIERLSTHGIEDEIIPSTFTNKQGREYPCYLLSDRVVTMLETIYLFQGFGDGKGHSHDYKPHTEPSTTYIMIDTVSGYRKIGCSSTVNQRLQAVQLGNPHFIEIEAVIRGGKELEAELHAKYADKHINGEWFNINEEDVYEINKKYKHKFIYEDTLDGLLASMHLEYDDCPELSVSDFTDSTNYKVLRKLKQTIQDGMNRKLPYKEIYKYAKAEVEKIIDSLCFKRVN